jgi:hypothetical protein
MKKIIFLLCLVPVLVNAQENKLESKKNEVRFDVLSVITSGKFGLSYERFIGKDFSVGLTANFLNSSSKKEDFNNSSRNNLPKYEFNPYVRYALSKSKTRYYFAEIFASANGGDYKEIVLLTDANTNNYYATQISKYSDFGLGGSLGYKMYIKEAWVIEFLVGFGSNLSNKEKSPDVIARVGLNLGYRF